MTTLREPRNLVVLLLDSLNRHELGAYGGTNFDTPNLDRLAAEGVVFTQHFAQAVPCGPWLCSSSSLRSVSGGASAGTATMRLRGTMISLTTRSAKSMAREAISPTPRRSSLRANVMAPGSCLDLK